MKVRQILNIKNLDDIEGHKDYIDLEAADKDVIATHRTLVGKDYFKLETIFDDGCTDTKDQELRGNY